MSSEVDLHIHSSFSDGTESVENIFNRAKYYGIKSLSITDHDSIDSVEIAKECSKKYNLNYVTGVELSTYSSQEIHILGYNYDPNNKDLKESLEFFSQKRIERAHLIIENLKTFGIDLNYEDLPKSNAIGRLHIAKLIVEKGYCQSIPEAFDKYLGAHGKAYFPSRRIYPFEAVKLITKAGGVPVIAHPLRFLNQNILEDMIIGLIPYGLKGIEVYYPTHDEKTISKLQELAKKYNLIQTGGTDFHGKNRNVDLGAVNVTLNSYTKRVLGF